MALTRVSGNLLTSTAVTAGIYGGSGNTVSLTVDAQGRVTAAANVVSSGGGITYTTVKTANYTAVADDGVQTNTTAGAFTVTLPATPANGDQVFVVDSFNTWGTNNLTIGRNGSTIEGVAQDLVCDITGVSVQCVYNGTTWDIFTQVGGVGGANQWTTTGSDIYYTTGNVGIGTSSPTAAKLHISGDLNSLYGIKLQSTRGTGRTYGFATVGTNADSLSIYDVTGSETSLMNFSNTGAVALKGGVTTATGTGITFPASQSASSDANTLDDYEEGTFTPAVTGSTTNPTVSYNWRYGYYTKIGNQVTLWFGYNVASISSAGSGDLRVTIPFTSANRVDNRIPGTVGGGVSYTAGSVLHISNAENTAYITFRQFNSTPASSVLSVSSLNGSSESVQMCITITVD